MSPRRALAAWLVAAGVSLAAATPAAAQAVPCGNIIAEGYAPVVTDCYDWVVQRYPTRPVLLDGRWVIRDAGLEFTLMSNVPAVDWHPKDQAMAFHKVTGAQVRFGAAQPADGSEPSQAYRESHLGIYVESEYVGDWHRFGMPTQR